MLVEEFAELATLLFAALDELTAMLEATLDATEETTEEATELDDGATLDATELALLELRMQVFFPFRAPRSRLILTSFVQVMLRGLQMHQRPFHIIDPVEILDLCLQGF